MRILAIDPGAEQSAWLELLDGWPGLHGIDPNETLLNICNRWMPDVFVIEQIQSYGMPVGREVFETVRWSGRFEEACTPVPVVYIPRREVKLHLCKSPKANDASIRMALLDRFGGKAKAAGTKANPGPLYGIHKDVWSALALAITYMDTHQ